MMPIILVILSVILVLFLIAIVLRRVVETNEVHIVQSSKKTTSYGKDTVNGNTYYEYPSWLPVLGVTKIVLPVSVFDLELLSYEAYDVGRVPFIVDVTAFFRISDTNQAAQRVQNFNELNAQLLSITQGAVRTVLASCDIDEIMLERSKFGEQFTKEVEGQLKSWGISTVKNIELMDIRDSEGSHVIRNIMDKKKSLIEMQSRIEVAENLKTAEIAEIEAVKERDLQQQSAEQSVGERTAEKDRAVNVANEQASQKILDQKKVTAEKDMEVIKVQEVKQAEINKNVSIVKAEEDKDTTILIAEGALEETKRVAEGIRLEGDAKAEAERAMQLAPVRAQIELAQEIGENEGYQHYLISIEAVQANKEVGISQAAALEKAEVKVIANTGEPVKGVSNVMELFSTKGGTSIGGMLEGIAQTPEGKTIINKLVKDSEKNK